MCPEKETEAGRVCWQGNQETQDVFVQKADGVVLVYNWYSLLVLFFPTQWCLLDITDTAALVTDVLTVGKQMLMAET